MDLITGFSFYCSYYFESRRKRQIRERVMIRQLTNFLSTKSTMMVLAFIALYFIWGSTYLAIQIASETMPPLTMLGLRFGVAGFLMLGWLKLRGKKMPSLKQWWAAFIVGSLMLCLGTGSVALAMQHIPTGLTALLLTTVPLWMVLIDWIWKGGARPSIIFFGGFALGLLGVFLLVDPATFSEGLQVDAIAMLGVLGGAIFWSAGSIQGKSCNLPDDPFLATAMQMAGGGIALLMAGFAIGEDVIISFDILSERSVFAWLYLLVFGSFIAFSAYIWLMRNTTPAKVSTYAYVNPVVAMYLGWAFANEEITSRILLASMLLISAVVIVIRFGPGKNTKKSLVSKSRFQIKRAG